MVFNCCHSRNLLFEPDNLRGIGAYDLRIEARLSGVETIVRNIRTSGNTKSIILLFLCTYQHVSGVTKSLMEYPKLLVVFLEGMHYKYIRSFLYQHNLPLKTWTIKEIIPPIEHDQSIKNLVSE